MMKECAITSSVVLPQGEQEVRPHAGRARASGSRAGSCAEQGQRPHQGQRQERDGHRHLAEASRGSQPGRSAGAVSSAAKSGPADAQARARSASRSSRLKAFGRRARSRRRRPTRSRVGTTAQAQRRGQRIGIGLEQHGQVEPQLAQPARARSRRRPAGRPATVPGGPRGGGCGRRTAASGAWSRSRGGRRRAAPRPRAQASDERSLARLRGRAGRARGTGAEAAQRHRSGRHEVDDARARGMTPAAWPRSSSVLHRAAAPLAAVERHARSPTCPTKRSAIAGSMPRAKLMRVRERLRAVRQRVAHGLAHQAA